MKFSLMRFYCICNNQGLHWVVALCLLYNSVITRHSRSHVWDLELEALMPVEYIDQLYKSHLNESEHSNCSVVKPNTVAIKVV